MNTLQNVNVNTEYSFLSNEDDARAIEDAIRGAVKVVLDVFWTINHNKVQEYQRKVAEKDRENDILRIRMECAERELVTLRQFKHSAEQCGDSLNSDTDGTHGLVSCLSTEHRNQRVCVVPVLQGDEKEMLSDCAWKRESMSPYEGRYSGAHPQEKEATACSWGSPPVMDLNHQPPIAGTTSPITFEGQPGGQPRSGRTFTITKVKEEPPDFRNVHIKWEMSEESVGRVECQSYPRLHPFAPLSQYRGGDSLAVGTQVISSGLPEQPGDRVTASASCQTSIQRLLNRERQQKYRERIRADPERQRVYREKDRNRYHNRRKLICDLPEHSQKLKREAWREAARRHRARKKNSASR
ncbi:hypothetical protein SKAU_G00221510 [Synaphobranchus kaupii]|uniref:Uncharacterized protein n=1 Tax=Synaphobranchus kaupii TaxID=118154 RepID=A0A9Q1FB65_SYNKA|nr:hypothetical protein SKAU_G00221510 [Synaphobranchus kaupii]